VLMDVQMPGVDGLAATRMITARWTREQRPRIIAVTANALAGDRELCLDAGMDDYLAKPVTRERLGAALAAAAPSISASAPAAPIDPGPAIARDSPLQVLVVDDNATNLSLAKAQFANLGYAVDTAVDGEAALEAVEHGRYDIVFMDVQMPRLDGLEATRQLCKRWSSNERPLIVGMTAEAGLAERRRCLDAGMDDCIQKPADRKNLAEILARCSPRSPR
jgi:CheY-like chemotaxis protein